MWRAASGRVRQGKGRPLRRSPKYSVSTEVVIATKVEETDLNTYVSQIGCADELDVKWERKRSNDYPRFWPGPLGHILYQDGEPLEEQVWGRWCLNRDDPGSGI